MSFLLIGRRTLKWTRHQPVSMGWWRDIVCMVRGHDLEQRVCRRCGWWIEGP